MGKKTNRKIGGGMQRLEEKAMMAGDVAVTAFNGDVWIEEAANSRGADQQISIQQLENGFTRIKGQNGTTINGQVEVQVLLSGDLDIDLGNGRDNVTMTSVNGGVYAEKIKIDMGDSNHRDFVSLSGFTATKGVEIDTGDGEDSVSINGATIGSAYSRIGASADLDIDTGDHRDVVSVYNTTIADDLKIKLYDYSWENHNDLVVVGWSSMDDLDVDMGGGDDHLDLYYNTIDDAFVDGDSGNDDVVAIGNTADRFEFEGDSGIDRFFAYYSGGQDSNDIDYLDLDNATFQAYGQV